jgi:hypothetical protein
MCLACKMPDIMSKPLFYKSAPNGSFLVALSLAAGIELAAAFASRDGIEEIPTGSGIIVDVTKPTAFYLRSFGQTSEQARDAFRRSFEASLA